MTNVCHLRLSCQISLHKFSYHLTNLFLYTMIYITVLLVNDENMTVYEKENDTLTGLYVQISVIPLYVETANPSMQKKNKNKKHRIHNKITKE